MYPSRVISFANQKGGVGKTTCVFNIGHALALKGMRVGLVDLDPQAHLTASFGYNPDELNNPGISEVMQGKSDTAFIQPNENIDLHLLPSNLSLAGVELAIAGVAGREFILGSYLKNFELDYILIDCPPSLGILTLNALTASKEVIIPMTAEYLPFRGVKGLIQTIELVKERLNSEIKIVGVAITRYDKRKLLSKSVRTKIADYFGDTLFETNIRENIAVAEAPAHAESIFEYSKGSHGAEDYEKLTNELMKRAK